MTAESTAAPDSDGDAGLVRVVVADDSPAIRTLARYALSPQRGFAVVGEAENGAEALELVEALHPDCVVLDIEMPGTGGFEALAELRRRGSDAAVVMLSGFSDASTVDKALTNGAAAYLDKSTELMQLAATVRLVTAVPAAAPGLTPAATGPAATGPAATGPAATGPAARGPAASAAAPLVAPPHRPTAVVAASVVGSSAEPPSAATTSAELRQLEYALRHDLTEPLRQLTGFATLLGARYAETLGTGGESRLASIVATAERLQAMVDELIATTRGPYTH